jgi:hypothetical protein
MTDLEQVLASIDGLSSEELEVVYKHVTQRRQAGYWLVPGENLKRIQSIMESVYQQTDLMDESEINTAIDEALDEVRRERRNQTDYRN